MFSFWVDLYDWMRMLLFLHVCFLFCRVLFKRYLSIEVERLVFGYFWAESLTSSILF